MPKITGLILSGLQTEFRNVTDHYFYFRVVTFVNRNGVLYPANYVHGSGFQRLAQRQFGRRDFADRRLAEDQPNPMNNSGSFSDGTILVRRLSSPNAPWFPGP